MKRNKDFVTLETKVRNLEKTRPNEIDFGDVVIMHTPDGDVPRSEYHEEIDHLVGRLRGYVKQLLDEELSYAALKNSETVVDEDTAEAARLGMSLDEFRIFKKSDKYDAVVEAQKRALEAWRDSQKMPNLHKKVTENKTENPSKNDNNNPFA